MFLDTISLSMGINFLLLANVLQKAVQFGYPREQTQFRATRPLNKRTAFFSTAQLKACQSLNIYQRKRERECIRFMNIMNVILRPCHELKRHTPRNIK